MSLLAEIKMKIFKPQTAQNPRNVILTGPPEAGKTLAGILLSRLPDTAVLNEPLLQGKFLEAKTALREIRSFFKETRRSLMHQGPAITAVIDRAKYGVFTDDVFEEPLYRIEGRNRWQVRWLKPFTGHPWLIVEHAAFFTALLKDLAATNSCYAMVRDPLVLLAAWNIRQGGFQKGSVPRAQQLDAELDFKLSLISDTWERQMCILSWFFETYLLLPRRSILSYEELVASRGKTLSVIIPEARELDVKLEDSSRSIAAGYPFIQELGARLLESEGPYWEFYDKRNIQTFLNDLFRAR